MESGYVTSSPYPRGSQRQRRPSRSRALRFATVFAAIADPAGRPAAIAILAITY